ncbi:MAG: transglycosylase SLT domain-containing protein [Roseibium sp.]|nr:transglycosylase SLT domain-containing protein [Roseibium sp.]
MRVAETTSIASRIEQAFQSASTSTGTSFDYLVKTAQRESSFNPAAKARTSSATGLFQFIESTWLETLKQAGARHGLEKYSDQIERTSSGKYRVADPQMRKEILDLRKDPEISSLMAGALTQKNASHLSGKLGRSPSDGELYMAHFLGATGATRLISAAESNPDMRADRLFSAQAKANKPIFYHRNGAARSMAEVYDVIVSKHDAVTMIASVSGSGRKPERVTGLTEIAALPMAKPEQPVGVPLARPDAPVYAQAAPAPASDPQPATDRPTQRILSAFQATETANPFEALFRNDAGSQEVEVKSRFASAFAAVQETAYSVLKRNDSKLAVQELASIQGGGPLDLTRFLQFRPEDEQRDLLPPV